MTTEATLERARSALATRELAQHLVDHALSRRVGDDVEAERILRMCRAVAADWDTQALAALVRGDVAASAERARALKGSVGSHVPPSLVAAASAVAEKPVRLSPEIVRRLLDHPETRVLIHDVLQVVLSDFVRRASTTLSDNRLVGGVMSAAKGFMSRSVTGTLLTAVGEGLNAEAERRIKDFLDVAVGEALARMVQQICDERHERAYGALRAGMLRAALGADVRAWTDQVMAADPAGGTLAMVEAVRALVTTEEFAAWLREHLPLWTPRPEETWGALLDRAGLGSVRNAAVDLVQEEVAGFLGSSGFAAWWRKVHDEETEPPRRQKAPGKRRK